MREMDNGDGYWEDEDTDSEPEADREVYTFDDGEREFWGESRPRTFTHLEEVDKVEDLMVKEGTQLPKEGPKNEYTTIIQIIFTMVRMGLLETLADDSRELSSEGENVQIHHSTIQGRSDQEIEQCDQKTKRCEQCYLTMMVSEPTGTPIHCAAIRGSKKKLLHVKVVVKGKHLDALVDTRATASFVQLGVIKKLGLEGKVEN